MRCKTILTAAGALCLTACALPSSAPPPATISPALLAPCPPPVPRALTTWGDLATAYSDASADWADCRARHRALAEAVSQR